MAMLEMPGPAHNPEQVFDTSKTGERLPEDEAPTAQDVIDVVGDKMPIPGVLQEAAEGDHPPMAPADVAEKMGRLTLAEQYAQVVDLPPGRPVVIHICRSFELF